MQSFYFIAYAVMASFAGLIIAHAQHKRMTIEGTPMNFGFLKVVGTVAFVMWVAAGITSLSYIYVGTGAA